MPKLPRAINLPGNDIGKKRQQLYKDAYLRISQAIESGYFLEAITICESIIADRLEARLAWVHQQNVDKRRFSTVGKLTQELCGAKLNESVDAIEIYRSVGVWADKRNKAMHQMVKLPEAGHETWEEKYLVSEKAAKEGLKLSKQVSQLVRKLNVVKIGVSCQ